MKLHRPVVALLAGDDRAAVPIAKSPHRTALPEGRCEGPGCTAFLARDNPGPYCSPCKRRDSGMPAAIAEYLHHD